MKYTITAEVDQQWFDMLGQLTRHQEGFVWITVEPEDRVIRIDSNGNKFLGDK